MVGSVVVLVLVVAGGRGGVLRGHDLREPCRRGARCHVLRAAHVGDAGCARGGGGGGGGGGAVVRGGDAARGGGARAAAAPLPPIDGAPGPETVHGAARRWDLGRRAAAARRWRGGGVGGRWGRARSRRRWSFQFRLSCSLPLVFCQILVSSSYLPLPYFRFFFYRAMYFTKRKELQ